MNTSKRHTKDALAQLFPTVQGQREAPSLLLIERSRLVAAPQVRTDLEGGIEELHQNIASLHERRLGIEGTGILQPLLASPDPEREGHFRLIAGERRLRASRGVTDELPVVVVPFNAQNSSVLQLIENLQRRDLGPLEEARGLQQLMEDQSLSIRAAAQLLGKPKSYLSDRLALLRMRPEVQAMVSERSDTIIHARELEAVSDDTLRQSLIEAVTHEQISLAEIRRRTTVETSGLETSNAPTPQAVSNQTVSERSDNHVSDDRTSDGHTSNGRNSPARLSGGANQSPGLIAELKGALGCMAQAERLLKDASLTRARRIQAQRQIEELEERTARLKKIITAD